MVQIEAPSNPECQEGVPSQGGHQKEEQRVVHHVQEEHYEGHIQWAWVIVTGVHGSGRSPKYPWVSAKCWVSQVIPGVQWEECIEPWTINQGLTLSTIRSSFNITHGIWGKLYWLSFFISLLLRFYQTFWWTLSCSRSCAPWPARCLCPLSLSWAGIASLSWLGKTARLRRSPPVYIVSVKLQSSYNEKCVPLILR